MNQSFAGSRSRSSTPLSMREAARRCVEARWLSVVLAAATLAACDDVGRIGDGLTDKPTPPATAREPLTPGAAGLAWAAPSSTADDWVVGPQGIGPLMVGAPYQSGDAQFESIAECSTQSPQGAPAGVSVWLQDGRILSILASQPGPHLLGGVEVGTSEAEVRRHFTDRLEEGVGADSGWLVEVRPETLSGHPVAFELENGRVSRIRVGASSPGGECR